MLVDSPDIRGLSAQSSLECNYTDMAEEARNDQIQGKDKLQLICQPQTSLVALCHDTFDSFEIR